LADFLEYSFETTFDLIIGNPPYFVIPKKSVKDSSLFTGRPNIYILFIIKSFELLNEHGILAFVLPTNFLNCIYYNELRKYLMKYRIITIFHTTEKFIDTSQEICVLIIQKTKYSNKNFCISFDTGIILFNENTTRISELLINTTTLQKLGFKLNIGSVVWNQCKKSLTMDSTKTLLIYSGDIKDNKLEIQNYSNESKKNYINKKGSTDIALLVNRGYGNGKYKLNYLLLNSEKEYLVENHLIVISHPSNDSLQVEKIIHSFKNPKTTEFIDLVFSNNAINIQEFLTVFPIFL
jgi:hypothetical protein